MRIRWAWQYSARCVRSGIMRNIVIAAASLVVCAGASEDAPSEADIGRCMETVHALVNHVTEIQCSRLVHLASMTKVEDRVYKGTATVIAELEFDVKEDITDLPANMCAGTTDSFSRGQRIKSRLSMDFQKNASGWSCNVNSLSPERKRETE
jgi:hypothetical protein